MRAFVFIIPIKKPAVSTMCFYKRKGCRLVLESIKFQLQKRRQGSVLFLGGSSSLTAKIFI